ALSRQTKDSGPRTNPRLDCGAGSRCATGIRRWEPTNSEAAILPCLRPTRRTRPLFSLDAAQRSVATGGEPWMNVVFVVSDAVPVARTGGLADVAGALPRALERQGHRPTLFVPCYRSAWSAGLELNATGLTLQIPLGARMVQGSIRQSRLPRSEVPVYLM